MLISKALGYVVILGSVAVKLPQIFRLIEAKSAAGISFSMFLLEVVGYTINLAYNYVRGNPFSTWGENFFLLAQTIVILALMFHYSGGIGAKVVGMGAVWALALSTLLSGQVPMEVMSTLQLASVGVFIASKVPQVISNFMNRSTGKLAFLTFFLNFAGSAARVFTTISEVDDKIILASAILGAVLNLTITLQILIFGDKDAAKAPLSKQASKKNAKQTGTVTPLGRSATSDESDDDSLSGSEDNGDASKIEQSSSPRSLEDSSGSSSGKGKSSSVKSGSKRKLKSGSNSPSTAGDKQVNKAGNAPSNPEEEEEEEDPKKREKREKKEKEKKEKEDKKAADKLKKEQDKAAKAQEKAAKEQEKAEKEGQEKAAKEKKKADKKN